MIPQEYYEGPDENEARAAEESTPLSELTNEAISIGAAYGIPSHVREFIRRNIPDSGMPSEEEIAFQEAALIEAQREMFNQRFNEAIAADLVADDSESGNGNDLTNVPNSLKELIQSQSFSQSGRMIRQGQRKLHHVPMDMTDFEVEVVDLVCAANSYLDGYDFEFDLDIEFVHAHNDLLRHPVIRVAQGKLALFELTLNEELCWSHPFLKEYLRSPSNVGRSHHEESFRFLKSDSVLVWQVCMAIQILTYSSRLPIPHGLAYSSLNLLEKSRRYQDSLPGEFHALTEQVQSALEAWGEDQADEYDAQQFVSFEKDRRRYSPVVEYGTVGKYPRELEASELHLVGLVLHAERILNLLDIGLSLCLSLPTKVQDPRGIRALVDMVVDRKVEGSLALTGKGNWVNFELSHDAMWNLEDAEPLELFENPFAAQRQFFRDNPGRNNYARLEIEFYEKQRNRIFRFVDSPLSLSVQCAWFVSEHRQGNEPEIENQDHSGTLASRIYMTLFSQFMKQTGRKLDEVDIAAWHIDCAVEMKNEIAITEYHQGLYG
jgi:hypothetical protein